MRSLAQLSGSLVRYESLRTTRSVANSKKLNEPFQGGPLRRNRSPPDLRKPGSRVTRSVGRLKKLNEVDRSWLPCPGLELSVRPGVGMSPWIVSDELWDRLEPLLPQRERRFRVAGRCRTGMCCAGSCTCRIPGHSVSICPKNSVSVRA